MFSEERNCDYAGAGGQTQPSHLHLLEAFYGQGNRFYRVLAICHAPG